MGKLMIEVKKMVKSAKFTKIREPGPWDLTKKFAGGGGGRDLAVFTNLPGAMVTLGTDWYISASSFSLIGIKMRKLDGWHPGMVQNNSGLDRAKEAEKWSFKSKIWKPKISSFVIKKP